MKILLAGPSETSALRASLGLRLEGAPPGTTQTPIAPLAGALRRRGHEVCIILTDPSIDAPVRYQEDGCTIEYIPLRGAPRHRARVRSKDLFEVEIRALHAAYLAVKPDLVHAHWTYEYAEAAVRSGLPHVVTMHDLGWQNVFLYRTSYRAIRLAMMLRVMPRIGRLTVVSPFMQKWARLHGYFGKVDVVPNGVELPSPSFASRAAGLNPFDRRPVRIVSIGDQTRRKNISASVAAFRIVRTQFPESELHLFGAGLDHSVAQGQVGIIPHGKVAHPDLMEFLASKATLLVHPALQETFGVILAEAMARGVPVVAGENVGGARYVANNGLAARLVDITKPERIADAVLGLLTDRQGYETLRQIGGERIASQFCVEAVAWQYISVYKDVLGLT